MQREHLDRLLRDGTVLHAPGPELLAAAHRLEQLGLIRAHPLEFVRCANPEDADFARSNRHCRGRIYLGWSDFRCPECERWVHPNADGKRRYLQLQVGVLREGVLKYLLALLEQGRYRATGICPGVYRVDAGVLGVYLCVADFCKDAKFLARDWASTQPTCYLTVDPRAAGRFLEEPWLHRLCLAEVLGNEAALGEAIEKTSGATPPASFRHAVVPIYAKAPQAYLLNSAETSPPARRFLVEVGTDQVLVEGVPVVGGAAGPRLAIFQILWEHYLEDLQHALPPARFTAVTLKDLTANLEARTARRYADETTVRRYLNRLREDIEEAVKRKTGLPVGREDIIQTCAWQGQAVAEFGYRLNPCRVVAGPLLPR